MREMTRWIEDIGGWLELDEAHRLRALAAGVPADLAIVEIGAFKGRSTCWMADGSRTGRNARIFSIDPWDPEQFDFFEPDTFTEYKANVSRGEWWDLVTPLRGRSVDVAKMWEKDIGLLFIDGLHDYENVHADYEAWHSFVAPGGVIAFHDVTLQFPDVVRVVKREVIPSGRWTDYTQVRSLWTARKI